jgi:hypothetical protein
MINNSADFGSFRLSCHAGETPKTTSPPSAAHDAKMAQFAVAAPTRLNALRLVFPPIVLMIQPISTSLEIAVL